MTANKYFYQQLAGEEDEQNFFLQSMIIAIRLHQIPETTTLPAGSLFNVTEKSPFPISFSVYPSLFLPGNIETFFPFTVIAVGLNDNRR